MPKKTLVHNKISITYDTDNPPDLLVYRCPHLNCDEFFFTEDELNTHKVKGHAELPRSMTSLAQPQSSAKHFSVGRLSHVKKLNSRQAFRHYGFMFHLFMAKDPTKTAKVMENPERHLEENKLKFWDIFKEKAKEYVDKRTKMKA